MSNVTAKVNRVELTEAQVADAMRQIEQAKKEAEARPLKDKDSPEGLAFHKAANDVGLPYMAVRGSGNLERRGLYLDMFKKWCIVKDDAGHDVLTWGDK